MTQIGFAEHVGINKNTLAKYETGDRAPDEKTLIKILDRLDIAGRRREEVLTTARGTHAGQWRATSLLERRTQLAALIRFETKAKWVFHNAPSLIPGVLQTSAYMRAIMESRWADLEPDEIEPRIATRIGRRDIITRRDPAHFVAVLSEAALRQLVGDTQVQIDQLHYLLELADLPNLELRAYRYSSGWHSGLEGPFILIEPEDDSPIVHVATGPSGVFLHEDDDLDYYRRTITTLIGDADTTAENEMVAMSPADTQKLIADVIKELETT